MIDVHLVKSEDEKKQIFSIREKVFVIEQNVAREEEYDEFEDTSYHFIAKDETGRPLGTARWRYTTKGIKLERFAVLEEGRGKGTGQALVKAVLNHVEAQPDVQGKRIYMHAQLPAVTLYSRFGFQKVGEPFEECNIMHYLMEKSI